LVTLGWRLGILAQRIPDPEAALRHTIEDLNNDVTNLVNDIQALSYGLHPPQLEYLGIAAAAASLCREVSDQQDVKVSFHAESVPQAIPQRISLCVYRVLQESLQNAIKHSGARHVEVSLCGGVDQLKLTVHDSGIGFDPDEAVKAYGLGLTSMKERLKAVQGQLYVDSKPQCGTTIGACVPLFSTNVKTAG
jgi:signal transduction histidine kinase